MLTRHTLLVATTALALAGAVLNPSTWQSQKPYQDAAPRPFGNDVGSVNFSEFLDGDVAIFGAVYVGPQSLLAETSSRHSAGDPIVPVAYAYTILKGDTYVSSRDGLHYKAATGAEPLHFVSASKGIHSEVAIFPRDDLAWMEVQSEADVVVSISAQSVNDD